MLIYLFIGNPSLHLRRMRIIKSNKRKLYKVVTFVTFYQRRRYLSILRMKEKRIFEDNKKVTIKTM